MLVLFVLGLITAVGFLVITALLPGPTPTITTKHRESDHGALGRVDRPRSPDGPR
jgi:hypothetical protein